MKLLNKALFAGVALVAASHSLADSLTATGTMLASDEAPPAVTTSGVGVTNTNYSLTLQRRYGVTIADDTPMTNFTSKFTGTLASNVTAGCRSVQVTPDRGVDISVSGVGVLSNSTASIAHQNTPTVVIQLSEVDCTDAASNSEYTMTSVSSALSFLSSTGDVFIRWVYANPEDPANPMVISNWRTGTYTGSVTFDVSYQ